MPLLPSPLLHLEGLPSGSALLLFALRITVSKINLNPRAVFPWGYLPLNFLSQCGKSCFLPPGEGISDINTLVEEVFTEQGPCLPAKSASQPLNETSPFKEEGQVREAQKRGQVPTQVLPIQTLFKCISAYIHKSIYSLVSCKTDAQKFNLVIIRNNLLLTSFDIAK